LQPLSYNFEPLLSSLLGIIAGAAVLYATGFLFDLIYFKLLQRPPIQGETQSMGGGDIKLLAMIGAFLGLKNALFTFIAAPFLGLPFGIFSLATKKDHTIPYGPFLALAALISIFYSDKIIRVLFFPWM
jgi:leader peptidase (prepilin peptidase)/N-methyltransferase